MEKYSELKNIKQYSQLINELVNEIKLLELKIFLNNYKVSNYHITFEDFLIRDEEIRCELDDMVNLLKKSFITDSEKAASIYNELIDTRNELKERDSFGCFEDLPFFYERKHKILHKEQQEAKKVGDKYKEEILEDKIKETIENIKKGCVSCLDKITSDDIKQESILNDRLSCNYEMKEGKINTPYENKTKTSIDDNIDLEKIHNESTTEENNNITSKNDSPYVESMVESIKEEMKDKYLVKVHCEVTSKRTGKDVFPAHELLYSLQDIDDNDKNYLKNLFDDIINSTGEKIWNYVDSKNSNKSNDSSKKNIKTELMKNIFAENVEKLIEDISNSIKIID